MTHARLRPAWGAPVGVGITCDVPLLDVTPASWLVAAARRMCCQKLQVDHVVGVDRDPDWFSKATTRERTRQGVDFSMLQ